VNAMRVTDLTLMQALACASSIPARLFGLKHPFRLPKPGTKANFVAFTITKSHEKWKTNLKAVFIDGEQRA
ncbi:MAG TPA: amidohydrolase family protein, partial [Candidatus Hydrogenedentes bacterium]|nr:amidohydrolase family protein [Candidatus Hydrogenedentota bacterium]